MGLFASKPEEPSEWAGLPSEPLGALSDSELLGDPPTADMLLGDTPPGVASITIPAVPEPTASDAGDATDRSAS
jgi:hypothetical protein